MRQTRMILFCLAVVLLFSAAVARADEIIYFTSGTTMPIRSHEVKEEMIHVDLGGDGFMAFPLTMVDKIEAAGKEVMLKPSFSGKNQRVTGTERYPVRADGLARDPSITRLPRQTKGDPAVGTDGKSGVAVYRPLRHSSHPAKRAMGAAGHQRVMRGGGGSRPGARRVGSSQVIGTDDPTNRGKPDLVGLEMKPKGPTPEPTETTETDSDE